jgi:hypothetical protein
MQFKDISIRPIKASDAVKLEHWRRAYWEGDLEIPFGYAGDGVETAVAERDGEILNALVAKKAVVLDPLIMNPDADHVSAVAGLYLLERALSYSGQLGGAIEAYIAIPTQLKAYHKIVEKAGYVRTVENCVVYRRPLKPEIMPLLGPERDAMVKRMDGANAAPPAEEKAKVVE